MEFDGGLSRAKAEQLAELHSGTSPSDPATTSQWWLIHYPDRDPVEVAFTPWANHHQVMTWHPAAVAAEPFTPTIRRPSAPLTAREEAAIRAWLDLIEETDPATIAKEIDQSQQDADARGYLLAQSGQSNS